MLVVIPSSLYGHIGAALSALIVAFSLIGLTLHKDFYAGVLRRDFYCYYTNLSNLVVFLYFARIAPRLYAHAALRPLIPHAEFTVMMSIMLTFCVFHLLLLPGVRRIAASMPPSREFSIMRADNFIEHYLVPWLVLLYWLLCSPGKARLRIWDAVLWTLLPLGYLLMIFLRVPIRGNFRGESSPYPYPFLDVRQYGVRRVAHTCALIFAICVLAGLGTVALARLGHLILGDGHTLILI